jgi:hypothetical protein
VSNASESPAQKRERDLRTYQFVSTSRNDRSSAHAVRMSYASIAAVVAAAVDRSFASTYRSRTCGESVRHFAVADSAFV